MKLLLTNDDGYDAEGLNALTKLIGKYGSTTVCAPLLPHSYAGHRVTTDRELILNKYQQDEEHYHLSGTPADCSRIALTHVCQNADWVISGINHGANLGVDVFTSGTVAAAREACILGYKAIAISHYICKGKKIDWDLATKRLAPALEQIFNYNSKPSGYWNINLPHPDHQELCEFINCPLDPNPLQIKYQQNNQIFRYSGDFASRAKTPHHDVEECLINGKITGTFLPIF